MNTKITGHTICQQKEKYDFFFIDTDENDYWKVSYFNITTKEDLINGIVNIPFIIETNRYKSVYISRANATKIFPWLDPVKCLN